MLTSRFPYPLDRGDKLRAYYHLRALAERHEVVLCALTEQDVLPAEYEAIVPFCSQIHVFKISKWKNLFLQSIRWILGKLPLQLGYFWDKSVAQQIQRLASNFQPNVVYCQLIRMSEYAKQLPYPVVLDIMDTFSMNTTRWAEASRLPLRWILRYEAALLRRYEQTILEQVAGACIISQQDLDAIATPLASSVVINPNGVDTEYFTNFDHQTKEYLVTFVGNMGYRPNIEAAKLLVEEIMPKVWDILPTAKLLIAGARPHAEVLQLQQTNVTVSGWVDDIRQAYQSAQMLVAPLQLGSGQQNKIMEAMAQQIPCITTPLVNNSIHAIDNESIVLATSPESFAQAIIRLATDGITRQQLASNGQAFVRSRYAWRIYTQQLEQILQKAHQNAHTK